MWDTVNLCENIHLNTLVLISSVGLKVALSFWQTLIGAPGELFNSCLSVQKWKGFLCKPFCQVPSLECSTHPNSSQELGGLYLGVRPRIFRGRGTKHTTLPVFLMSLELFLGWGPCAVFGSHFCTMLVLTLIFVLVSSTHFQDTADYILICKWIHPEI